MLMPAIRINVVTNIIGSLSVFDVIMALTEGGPGYATESLSIYIMRMCYGSRTRIFHGGGHDTLLYHTRSYWSPCA